MLPTMDVMQLEMRTGAMVSVVSGWMKMSSVNTPAARNAKNKTALIRAAMTADKSPALRDCLKFSFMMLVLVVGSIHQMYT